MGEWGGREQRVGREAQNKQCEFFPQNLSPPPPMGRASPHFKMERANKAEGPLNKIATPQESQLVFPGIVKSGVEGANVSLACCERFRQHLSGPPASRGASGHVHRSPQGLAARLTLTFVRTTPSLCYMLDAAGASWTSLPALMRQRGATPVFSRDPPSPPPPTPLPVQGTVPLGAFSRVDNSPNWITQQQLRLDAPQTQCTPTSGHRAPSQTPLPGIPISVMASAPTCLHCQKPRAPPPRPLLSPAFIGSGTGLLAPPPHVSGLHLLLLVLPAPSLASGPLTGLPGGSLPASFPPAHRPHRVFRPHRSGRPLPASTPSGHLQSLR